MLVFKITLRQGAVFLRDLQGRMAHQLLQSKDIASRPEKTDRKRMAIGVARTANALQPCPVAKSFDQLT